MPTGIGKIFMVLLGVSPVVAIMLYFVMQKQDNLDKKFDYEVVNIQKNIADFNEDFANDQKNHATSKTAKKYYEKKAEKYGLEVAQIDFERESKRQKAIESRQKADQIMNELDNEVADLDESDFNF